ncbi:glucose-6-phosphate dehydrogenase [Halomonas sp. McH1-25]|uniref:glucose-6-phosphate dehydrogenase n=1 Tax=unclassified Halomonas TaxID=2609666 RepID=UPI001EF6C0DE|nr:MULTISPECIES: glucose-6-phosphate dehydrogenase [unclassified Halomonas]MCG7600163.1 glucose-6-phosphate dehydrogenase [Halomonas sp. McH1-25]MCP1341412.1 glucose-6-phosphate dehydrogenase [Halomonas sp. FL8]MCP1359643.1 glucose-6-phosphate dehydrogenase [Halomonas sp. BBD45]MCP1365193.1 glucose-6-phosphate dehydrogenase [Halomonas sp. BBD48]
MIQDTTPDIDLALFGAMGDLALRKLYPALYHLDRDGLLAGGTRILGLARQDIDAEAFRKRVEETLKKYVKAAELEAACLKRFLNRLDYIQLDFIEVEGYKAIREWHEGAGRPMTVYLAVPASIYGAICHNLQASGSLDDESRVVVEKPIGYDLESSQEINDAIGVVFPESRVYRIDHYLGKETVQNLIALRFANPLFGTQWNQNHISHVEITVAEQVGIEGRWGYFDKAGQLRDMVQNHLLQLLCLIAMDPPSNLDADAIRDEKVKVLKALKKFDRENVSRDVVRGQYIAGSIKGTSVPGYLEEEGANAESRTETFVAIRTEVSNWRWAGVPFYLRTGKRMPDKVSQIVIHFRQQPHYIFDPDQRNLASNKLIIRLQPEEGIALEVLTKDGGLDKGMRLRPGPLHLDFNSAFPKARIPDAYERLLLEVMKGNQYLFVRRDEVEYAWRWADQLVEAWEQLDRPPRRYPSGSWGPVASIAMITQDGRSWYEDY